MRAKLKKLYKKCFFVKYLGSQTSRKAQIDTVGTKVSDPDPPGSLSFCRIRIHETFDDMDPDLVAKPTQIMGK